MTWLHFVSLTRACAPRSTADRARHRIIPRWSELMSEAIDQRTGLVLHVPKLLLASAGSKDLVDRAGSTTWRVIIRFTELAQRSGLNSRRIMFAGVGSVAVA